MSFKEYQSKPITRKACEVLSSDNIQKCQLQSTSAIEVDGERLEFKHYEPVKVGDFIVYLNDDDIYHCDRAVFVDRNIVE